MSRATLTPRRARLLLGVLALPVLAASCFFAFDEDKSAATETSSAKPERAPQARATAGSETVTRAEWNARVTAMKRIEEQRPEARRRYHETWIGALQRTQGQQRAARERLVAQRDELRAGSDERAALEQRLAQIEQRLAASEKRLEEHASAVAALR